MCNLVESTYIELAEDLNGYVQPESGVYTRYIIYGF